MKFGKIIVLVFGCLLNYRVIPVTAQQITDIILEPPVLKNDSMNVSRNLREISDSTLVIYNTQIDELNKINKYKSEKKSNAAAFFWSIVVPGGGHFYLGNNKTGALYLVGVIGSALASGGDHPDPKDPPTSLESTFYLVYFIGYFANIIHSPIAASAHNRKLKEKYGLTWTISPGKNSLALNLGF
jgi:hypothetical protein